MKWLIAKWFSSSNHGSPYYIGGHVKRSDTYLLHQTPPHDFSQAQKNIVNFGKLVNTETFYFITPSPFLLPYYQLPPLYFHHYYLLVSAIHTYFTSI